jgi:hypothetical protein
MNHKAQKSKYPHPKSRIYLSVIITVLSMTLALPLLPTLPLILYYFISTGIIVTITFILKRRFFYTEPTEIHQRASKEESEPHISWKILLLVFSIIILVMMSPLFLASVLDPSAWFILMISFTSGISISEILLYVYMR